ncbi:hypothetical protein HU200_021890 [Digitaria exilis]|uniref:Uncharacterized protein n=1 Tax=Digitaria exilis TaxID=1010633 RepID=A0A835EZ11_9POAL|nr:hypothetical protein HU200_021890 [Digitaria exilis]
MRWYLMGYPSLCEKMEENFQRTSLVSLCTELIQPWKWC